MWERSMNPAGLTAAGYKDVLRTLHVQGQALHEPAGVGAPGYSALL
jgi:hypothetical protein